MDRRLPPTALGAIAVAALLTRLAHAYFLSKTPFFAGPVIDAHVYRQMAERIAETGSYGGAFYQPPLYPAFLAVLIREGLGSPWAIAITQSLLGALLAPMVASVAAKLASEPEHARTVGVGAGLVTAFYGPAIFFDLELLPPVIVHPLLVGALLVALRTTSKVTVVDALGGLMMGVAATGWGPSLVLGLVAPLHRARHLSGRRAQALLAVVWLVAMALPVSVTASHNARHDASGVVVSFNDGINLWLGNNPDFRDTWRARPGAAFEPELERPDREGVTRPRDRSQYFFDLVLRDAREHPGAAIARTAEKLYYAWHGREIRRNQDIETIREASPVLWVTLFELGIFFPFGVLAPLAISAFVRRRRELDVRLVGLAALAYSGVLALFFVSSRYRLPLALWLLPLAVDEAFALYRDRRAGVRRFAPLLVALVLLNLPNAFTASFAADDVERAILEAHAYRNQGQTDRAETIAEELVAERPDDANVQMLAAEMESAAGRCDRAVISLQRVVELAPRASTPRVMLGHCLEDLGDPAGAERAYAGALALHPHHAVALKSAAALYLRTNRPREARALLRRFVDAGYDDAEVNEWLGQLDAHLPRR